MERKGSPRDEFRAFGRSFFARYPGLEALAWAPRVPASQREAHEQARRKAGDSDYRIHGRDTKLAASATEFFPIEYLDFRSKSTVKLGWDLGSDPVGQEIVKRVQGSTSLHDVEGLRLAGDRESGDVVVGAAVFDRDALDSPSRRSTVLRGIVLGEIHLDHVIDAALASMKHVGIDIEVLDRSQRPAEQTLCVRLSNVRALAYAPDQARLAYEVRLPLPNRHWILRCTPTDVYLAVHRSWLPWSGSGACLMITILLTLSLNTLVGRTSEV